MPGLLDYFTRLISPYQAFSAVDKQSSSYSDNKGPPAAGNNVTNRQIDNVIHRRMQG